MNKRIVIVVFLAATAFFLTACGGDPIVSPPFSSMQSVPNGNLSAIPTDEGDPEQSTTAPPKTPSPLLGISPCSVVPPETITQRKATAFGPERRLGGGRHCDWSMLKGSIFSVTFFDTVGIKDASAEGDGVKTTATVGTGRHDAIQQPRQFSCAVSIAITENTRVDIQFRVSGAEPLTSCPEAKALADEVEPHLPPQVK